MNYCEKSDILADFKSLSIESSGTVVTTGQLEFLIEEESDFIDGYITQRYVLPILQDDYPKAFNILKRICVFRVSERVRNKLEVKSNATQATSDEKFKDNRVRTPNDDLMDVVNGKLILIDVPTKSKELGVASFTSKTKGTCSVFDVNKQQW
jgi:phage gp36-like protein